MIIRVDLDMPMLAVVVSLRSDAFKVLLLGEVRNDVVWRRR